MNNSDHISESLETFFWDETPKIFYADPGSGKEKIRIRNTEKNQYAAFRIISYA